MVTGLFTDIVGSTALWDQYPEAMTEALAEHDERIGSIVAGLSLIHISEPTRLVHSSRMPSSA